MPSQFFRVRYAFRSMQASKPPRLEFLRRLLPQDLSEDEFQAEEARLMRYIALVERIAKRVEHERQREVEDSTQSDSDSSM